MIMDCVSTVHAIVSTSTLEALETASVSRDTRVMIQVKKYFKQEPFLPAGVGMTIQPSPPQQFVT
jgi:hypothetical protein